jgi:gamma-glutamyltranspeptidase/glutathione hydrolase
MRQGRSGAIAAGHPLSVKAGAEVLRAGGNAVDGALGALLVSFVAEPLLTGLGAGGYMLVAGGGRQPELIDFFIDAPPRRDGAQAAELLAVNVSFGDAEQVFHVGPASCGVYGAPAGICAAASRWGSMPVAELVAPAVKLAREGVPLNASQAYVASILSDLLTSSTECSALWAPGGRVLREGELFRSDELAQSLLLLGSEGAEPFYRGSIAAAVASFIESQGGAIGASALASYEPKLRAPLSCGYRSWRLHTNPPPAAGGLLLAYALALLERRCQIPALADLVAVMEAAQAARGERFLAELSSAGFAQRLLDSACGKPGGTTHVAVIDRDGMACSMTTTNGEGSAVVVPGTGIHMNNIMGEADLNPGGFHRHRGGERVPSMMAPTILVGGDDQLIALGSAGSNRIRSAILQTISAIVDRGMDVPAAVNAPRLHAEDGVIYCEPGIDEQELAGADRALVAFHDRNLFFGGVQAVARRGEVYEGAGDPRRGGDAALL